MANRAVTVAERLLKHGRADVLVQITRQGQNNAGKLAYGLTIKADPETTVEALELLANELDRLASMASMVGAVDA